MAMVDLQDGIVEGSQGGEATHGICFLSPFQVFSESLVLCQWNPHSYDQSRPLAASLAPSNTTCPYSLYP